jgi:regulator of RNase E activity RraA
MHGPDIPRPDAQIIAILRRASTATITTIFRRLGIRNIWMPLKPLFPGSKTVGSALTVRTVPGRDDLQSIAYEPGTRFPGHPDDAIDALRPGDVLVLDGRGATDEGLFGDLLTQRVKEMGADGLVCDMAVRDAPHMAEKNLPIFCRGSASPGGTVFNIDVNVPIGCAGVLVIPGDLIVGDDDGVVVVPQGLAREVAEEIVLREDKDEFVRLKLAQGASLRGLYPMGPQWEERFQEWRRQRGG